MSISPGLSLADACVVVFLLVTLLAICCWPAGSRKQLVLGVLSAGLLLSALVAIQLERLQALPAGVLAVILLAVSVVSRYVSVPPRLKVCLSVLLGSSLLIAALPFYFFPAFMLPVPTGPFSVGTLEADWPHQFAAGSRRLKVRFWYPAQGLPQGSPAPYLASAEADGIARAIARTWSLPVRTFAYLARARSHSYTAAAPAAGGAMPLVMFSHGYWFYAAQNTALMEELASHGFIVASVAHPGDSMPVVFANGERVLTIPYAGSLPGPAQQVFFSSEEHAARVAAFPVYQDEIREQRVLSSLRRWRADLLGVLDDLQAGTVPDSVRGIAERADFARIAFAGMSFGGTVAASTCAIEPRCRAAINLDGEEYDATLFGHAIDRPLLMLNSDWVNYRIDDRPQTPQFVHTDYFYESFDTAGQAPEVYRGRVLWLRHLGFTDLPLLFRRPLRDGFTGALDRREALAAVNGLSLAFLQRTLLGNNAVFPDAAFGRHPSVERRDASDVRQWRSLPGVGAPGSRVERPTP